MPEVADGRRKPIAEQENAVTWSHPFSDEIEDEKPWGLFVCCNAWHPRPGQDRRETRQDPEPDSSRRRRTFRGSGVPLQARCRLWVVSTPKAAQAPESLDGKQEGSAVRRGFVDVIFNVSSIQRMCQLKISRNYCLFSRTLAPDFRPATTRSHLKISIYARKVRKDPESPQSLTPPGMRRPPLRTARNWLSDHIVRENTRFIFPAVW